MNNDTMISGDGDNIPHTFDRKELIEGVLQKHKKFLEEYNSELNELGNKLKELQENIESSKKGKAEVIDMIEILTEKRQLFYHQAEKSLDEIGDSITNEHNNFDDISRELSYIREKLSKVKGSLSPEEEQKQINTIMEGLSSLSSKVPEITDRFDSVKKKINAAFESKKELSAIDNSEEDHDNNISSYEESIKEIEPRYKWLEKRIKSHKEALEYWEKQPFVDAEEVKA